MGFTLARTDFGVRHAAVRTTRAAAPLRTGKTPPGASGRARAPASRADTPGTSCVTGSWWYQDQTATWQPGYNTFVQVLRSGSAIASGYVGSDAHYTVCWSTGGVTQNNITVNFREDNPIWKVVDGSGNSLVFGTGAFSVADGATQDLGSLTPADSTLYRGVHAYEEANDEWEWDPTNACWDPGDTSCRQLSIIWYPTSTDGTYWNGAVHLAADDPNAQITVDHEVGHNLMYELFDDNFPAAPNCNPHSIFGVSSTGCAWTEGWAEWVPASVYNDPNFRWPSGAVQPLETPTWGDGNPYGDALEGRVAGALIDISDVGSEPYYDNYGENGLPSPGTIFQEADSTAIAHPGTFADFWSGRAALGYNTASSGALASVYQNTIDYNFRNPLTFGVPGTYPVPPTTRHNYSMTTSTDYWSAVVIRPGTNDYDLSLYGDSGLTSLLAGSDYGTGVMDYTAIDSNRQALATYYPSVNQFAGSGTYDIEAAQGSTTLSAGSSTATMGTQDVASIRDSFQNAGVPVYVRVVPSSASQQGEVALLGDDPATASTWVQGRSAAKADSGVSAAGQPFGFVYTPGVSEYYGLLLMNAAGSGTYTLYVDTAAPTGTISVNSGATYTKSTNVTLSLSATNPTSGDPVTDMRFSNDGTNYGAWQPYATSASYTLPSGDGPKTVFVQFRNGAGAVSSAASDSITLDTTPPSITNAPAPSFTTTQLASTAVPILIKWAGTDAASGIAHYDLQESVDGGAFSTVASPTTASVTQNLAPGHSYKFQVRATDKAGNVSGYTASASFTLSAFQETASAITYSTGWTKQTLTGSYGGSVKFASIAGKTAKFSFSGSQVAWVSTIGSNRGSATAKLDAGTATTVNTTGTTLKTRMVVYTKTIAAGTHSLLLKVLGTAGHPRVDIDAFLVIK
jgi:hypothetical protein